MEHKLISLTTVQLLRLACLVRSVRPERIDRTQWALRVNGRGFTRLLADDPLLAPNLIRPAGAERSQVRAFYSLSSAQRVAESLGLGRLLRH